MSGHPRRANGPRQYYAVSQSPASTSHYTQYTTYSQPQPQPQPSSHHQQRKTRRQIRRVPPPSTNHSRSSHESRSHESRVHEPRRGEMAHSVATGVIGGGYGPYSVSPSSSPKSLANCDLNVPIVPLVQSSRNGIEFRPLHRKWEFGDIHNIYERETHLLERWTSTTVFAVPCGS